MKHLLKESYEPEIKNGLYNTALMNLDDVRKCLPKNTSKEIWDLYQQLFDTLEKENVNNITSDDSDGFTIFIQAVDPFDTDYQELRKFEGRTFHLDNVQKIDKIEQERLGVEDCEYCGYINFEGHELPIPFSKDVVNSKKSYSYQWIYACYIRHKIQESKNMKRDNKKLYESIMASVAKEVKKALNEDILNDEIKLQNIPLHKDKNILIDLFKYAYMYAYNINNRYSISFQQEYDGSAIYLLSYNVPHTNNIEKSVGWITIKEKENGEIEFNLETAGLSGNYHKNINKTQIKEYIQKGLDALHKYFNPSYRYKEDNYYNPINDTILNSIISHISWK